jgi:hypothetical protein
VESYLPYSTHFLGVMLNYRHILNFVFTTASDIIIIIIIIIIIRNIHNNKKKELGKCGPCPVFANYALEFALQLRKKHGSTSVRVVKKCPEIPVAVVHYTFTHKPYTEQHNEAQRNIYNNKNISRIFRT